MVRAFLYLIGIVFVARVSASALPDFTDIVEASAPAVVKILVEYESDNPRYQEQLEELPEDRKSTRLNSSHSQQSRMPSSA